jgi:lipopolysaccharide export system protein LptA
VAFSISRLRLWLGLSALLMVLVVAGFYLYARYRVERAVRHLPGKLGVNIQQTTNGFTYSQAVGGRTIYAISASNAVRYKRDGKAELHNVHIVSYGRQSDRLDEISGDDFEYDSQSGDVTAKGQVSIVLQATEPGTSSPGVTPQRIGSVVHLQTSGLVFNQKTGIAHTSDKITFELPQGAGSAVGANYDSRQNTFQLFSNVQLLTGGPKPANLQATTAVFTSESHELTLTSLRVQSGIRRLETQHLVLHLRPDNTVESADATGGVNGRVEGTRSAQIQAANADFTFGSQNDARTGRLTGGVSWATSGATASHGNAGQVLLTFGSDNHIKSAQLRDHVDLVQLAANPDTGQGTEFRGDGLDVQVGGGTNLETANSVGAAQILMSNVQTVNASGTAAPRPAGKTLITASRFDAKFSPDNRLSALAGTAPVKIVSSTAGKPDRVSQSQELLATFTKGKTQVLEELIQTGDVQIQDGKRNATAESAIYNQSADSMTLSGNVRYTDPSSGSALTSTSLVLNRARGETTASGEVKTTYVEQKGQPSGAMLSPSQSIHVTAQQMLANDASGEVRYSGDARLWQGGNIVEAPTLEFNRSARALNAQAEGSSRVSTVFVQPDKNGKQAPVEVTSDNLHYDDSSRKAIFDGDILLRSADSRLRASKAVVTLRSEGGTTKPSKTAPSNAPSQVQTIEATGNVLLQQPGRRATGTHLVYTDDEEKFVLTGSPGIPPSIFDAEHGQVTGVSLTFFTRDDRVLVDSSNSISITQTRLKK